MFCDAVPHARPARPPARRLVLIAITRRHKLCMRVNFARIALGQAGWPRVRASQNIPNISPHIRTAITIKDSASPSPPRVHDRGVNSASVFMLDNQHVITRVCPEPLTWCPGN